MDPRFRFDEGYVAMNEITTEYSTKCYSRMLFYEKSERSIFGLKPRSSSSATLAILWHGNALHMRSCNLWVENS